MTPRMMRVLAVASIVVATGIALAAALRPPTSLDAFWHLRTGADWLMHGLAPWTDHYSFTFAGAPVASQPYLFQVLLAALVNALGVDTGFGAYRSLAFVFLIGMMLMWLRQVRAPAPAVAVCLASLMLLALLRNIARPELVSFGLSIALMVLINRQGLRFELKRCWPVVALIWLWCNYHSPVFGYIIAFGWFVDGAVALLKDRAPLSQWRSWLVAGIAVVAVGFANPTGVHPILTVLGYAPEWRDAIQEYQVPLLHGELLGIYAILMLSAATLVLIVQQRRAGFLVVWLVVTYYALLTARLVTPAGIIVVAMFAATASASPWRERWRQLPGKGRHAATLLLAVATCLPLASSLNLTHSFWNERGYAGELYPGTYRYPADVVDYMRDSGLKGRVFNDYETGGYLVYRLAPDMQVYIDGRTAILYPYSHFRKSFDIRLQPEQLRAELDRFSIDFALVEGTLENHVLLRETGALSLDFAGTKYSLFKRTGANFARLGLAEARPACANDQFIHGLREEFERAHSLLPVRSPLLRYVALLSDYRAATDKSAFLEDLEVSRKLTDAFLRFAGYRMFAAGMFERAYSAFVAVRQREPKDLLAMATIKTKQGKWNDAEELAEIATRTRWPRLETLDLQLMRELLREIERHQPLTRVGPEFMASLERELAAFSATEASLSLVPDAFCGVDSTTR